MLLILLIDKIVINDVLFCRFKYWIFWISIMDVVLVIAVIHMLISRGVALLFTNLNKEEVEKRILFNFQTWESSTTWVNCNDSI